MENCILVMGHNRI